MGVAERISDGPPPAQAARVDKPHGASAEGRMVARRATSAPAIHAEGLPQC